MVLIIGGAYQGKRAYAGEVLGLRAEAMEDCDADREPSLATPCLVHFEQWVLGKVRQGADAEQALRMLLPVLADKVILCEDIQCGVVPMDDTQRAWRDANGRCLCLLARHAQSVVRLCCGLPLVLKP